MNPLTAAAALLEVVLAGPWIWARQQRGVRLRNALLVPGLLVAIAIVSTAIPSDPRLPAVAAFVAYAVLIGWRVVAIRPLESDRYVWRAARRFGLRQPPLIVSPALTLALMLSTVTCVALMAQSIPILLVGLTTVGFCVALFKVPESQWLKVVSPPLVIAIVGIALGAVDRSWSWIDPSSTSSVSTQLVSAQLALGVVPIAVATVGGQVAISWIGPRATRAIPIGWVLGSIGAVLVSVTLDLFLIGHASSSIVWVELAELVAVVTVAFAGLAVLNIVRSLEPERVAQRFVRRLDRNWLQSLLQSPGRRLAERPVYLDDPFRAVERVLSAAVGRDTEQQLFRVCLALLADQIRLIGFTRTVDDHDRETFAGPLVEVEAALDDYLAGELEALVYVAAQQRRHWAVEELIRFRHSLQPVVTAWVETGPTTAFGTPSEAPFPLRGAPLRVPDGCQTYALVFRASLDGGLDESAWLAAVRLAGFIRRGLKELPPADGVLRIDPNAQAPGQPGAGAELRDAIEGFDFVFRRWVRAAVSARNVRALEGLASVPEDIVDAALRTTDDRWAPWLADRGLRLGVEAAIGAEELGEFVMPLRMYMFPLQAGNSAHAGIAESLALWVPPIIRAGQRKLPVGAIVEFSMIALDLLPAYPNEAARIADAIVLVKDRMLESKAPGAKAVANEVDARIKQLRQNAGASLNQFNRALRNLRKARQVS